jgi:hypothetical protein
MKTTEYDIPYCGVDVTKIESATPSFNEEVLRYHHNYIFERHKIYKKKEIYKLPRPWTKDPIFNKYRFTNVRRELDRESKWLIKHICENDELTLKQKILNCILFRTYNKSSTSEIIKQPILNLDSLTEEDFNYYRNIFIDYANKYPKYVFFTAAFLTSGLKKSWVFYGVGDNTLISNKLPVVVITDKGDKIETDYANARELCANNTGYLIENWEENMPTRMLRLVSAIEPSKIDDIISANSQQEIFDMLRSIKGVSNFLSYQMFVDFTYIPGFKFSENEFTISGPGCSQGISYLFEDKSGMNDEECIFWVRDNMVNEWVKRGLETDLDSLFDHLPKEDRCLNVMMLENSFCELSKYTKAITGKGRPKQRFKSQQPIEEIIW